MKQKLRLSGMNKFDMYRQINIIVKIGSCHVRELFVEPYGKRLMNDNTERG